METLFKELWFVLIVGTSVILILIIVFITSLVCCNRRIRKFQDMIKGGGKAD